MLRRLILGSARIASARASLLAAAVCCALAIGTAATSSAATQDRPSSPKFLPPLEAIALPHEQAVFQQLMTQMPDADKATTLPILDAALAKLPEPTKLRGFVQMTRAAAFSANDNFPKAAAALEESIRLLPGYSAPLILAAGTFSYANQPAKGADYLLRAAELDPDTVRMIDDYEINNIMTRLTVARDERRAFALSDRLLDIGWIGSRLGSQSKLATSAIERRVRDGDLAGARVLVPKLLVPGHSYSILADRRYSSLWDGVERWAGPRLERQWVIYLREARERWAASKAPETVQDYSTALLAAGHYDTVIRDILPIFSPDLDAKDNQDLVFVVTGVAQALARKGRWADVDALFDRAQKIWPLGSHPNALNVTANRAQYLLLADRPADSLKYMDLAIAEARRADVNRDALAAMHHYRACALHQLGRTAEATASAALAMPVLFSDDAASLHFCMGNGKAARQVILKSFEDPANRQGVIDFFQPQEAPLPSEYSRRLRARTEALRTDPELLGALQKYGRVLPFRVGDGAPRQHKTDPPPRPPEDLDVS